MVPRSNVVASPNFFLHHLPPILGQANVPQTILTVPLAPTFTCLTKTTDIFHYDAQRFNLRISLNRAFFTLSNSKGAYFLLCARIKTEPNSNTRHCVCQLEKYRVATHIDIFKTHIHGVHAQPPACMESTQSVHRLFKVHKYVVGVT